MTRLELLIAGFLDESLTDPEVEELESLLKNDEALEIFFAAVQLDEAVRHWYATEEIDSQAKSLLAIVGASDERSAEPEVYLPNAGGSNSQVPCSRKFSIYGLFVRPTPVSITVAAVVLGLMITAMAFMTPPVYRALTQRVPADDEIEQYQIVAELTGVFEVDWAEDADVLRPGAFLIQGRRIAIDSGAVTVSYRSGAKVTIAGPCELLIDGANRGSMSVGQLVASIPPAAVGFTVETPAVKVVDLGTDFAMEVSEDGKITVDVLVGRVRAESKFGHPQRQLELLAGDSLRFDGAWHVAAGDHSRHAQWRSLARSTDVQRLNGVQVVDFSSELTVGNFDRRAACLVDGSGLVGQRHTALTEPEISGHRTGTMWLTNGTYRTPHDPLPVHVTFDLGDVYELAGIHVWNYNEAAMGLVTRGARAVEISVAPTSNASDLVPLTNAQGNFEFPMATGRGDYGGFAVPLGEVKSAEALAQVRLVRFTILSNHGPNPQDHSDQFAGLSEVRFAGRKLLETHPSPETPESSP